MHEQARGPHGPAAGTGRARGVLSIAGFALAAWASAAQAQDQEPAYRGLLGTLKRPYFSVGALLQTVADFQIERSRPGNNGFSVANFRISLSGELDRRIGYFLQTNFAASRSILDARLHYRPTRRIRLDVGQFKVPFSGEFLTGAADLDFVNRAEAVTALAPGRQIGFQGTWELGDRLTLRAGGFNGNTAGANGNDNDALLYALRVEARPVGETGPSRPTGLVVGGHVARSRDSAATLSGLLTAFEGTRTLLGADARFWRGRWLLAGEVIFGRLTPPTGKSLEPVGHHLSVGYRVSRELQTLIRWERFDRAELAPTQDVLIGGLNFFPTSFAVVKVNYLVQTRDAGIRRHGLLINFQFGF